MAKHAFGLAKIEYADIANDGGAGTVFTEIGETVAGSCQLTSSDPQSTDFNIEESDSPVESVVSTPAEISLATSTYDVSADQLVALFGGTKTAGPPVTWEAPDQLPELEKTFRLTDKKGNTILIPRGKIASKLGVSFAKDKLGQLDLTIKVLQPTKAGVKRLKFTYA
jgi:hypothetical protein